MSNPAFNPDDPRLTAFALGELDGQDRTEIEQLLETSPEAKSAFDEIQDTIGVVKGELAAEPAVALTDGQRAAVESEAGRIATSVPAATTKRRSYFGRIAGATVSVAALAIVVTAILPAFQQAREASPGRQNEDVAADVAMKSTPGYGSQHLALDNTSDRQSVIDAPEAAEDFTSSVVGESSVFIQNFEAKDRDSDDSLVSRPANSSTLLTDAETFTGPAKNPRLARAVSLKDMKSQGVSDGNPDVSGSRPGLPVAAEKSKKNQDNGRRKVSRQLAGGRQQNKTSLAVPTVTSGPRPTGEAGKPSGGRPYGSQPVAGGTRLVYETEAKQLSKKAAPTSEVAAIDAPRSGSPARLSGRRITSFRSALSEEARDEDRAKTGFGRSIEGLRAGAGNEAYDVIIENDFIVPVPHDREKRLSTISVDVDTASYANVRRFLTQGQLPPKNAVRIEELINYFSYDYPQPEGDSPFSVTAEVAICPWNPEHRLARIGLQAKEIDKSKRPPTNLVFLLDVSGSMRPSNKLPLVKQAMKMLVEQMTEDDQISIVTYASNAGVKLEATTGAKRGEINQAIDMLNAGGSTNGEGGIQLAYDAAIRSFIQDGANRVILCTDGDFNVGISDDNQLIEVIQEKAASGVFLSVFGFGMGNLKDSKLEKLADKGNGHYGYIDNFDEARRVFNEDLVGTLYTVAKDVKLQAEFNPNTVGAYRLIGYENRVLAAQDFNDDAKDAGEIGAGHTVTALYEIVPKKVWEGRPGVDPLRYEAKDQPEPAPKKLEEATKFNSELFFVKLRYKNPDEETSKAVPVDIPVNDIAIAGKQLNTVSGDMRWAAAVASFGMNLRQSKYRGNWGLRNVYQAAEQARGEDENGRRSEFIGLVKRTLQLTGQAVGPQPRTEIGNGQVAPAELPSGEARVKAAVNGKYRRLLKKIKVEDDLRRFGAFEDYGFWDEATEYKGHSGLLPGHWVYVYPHWYIWGDVVKKAETSRDSGESSGDVGDAPKGGEAAPSDERLKKTVKPESSKRQP